MVDRLVRDGLALLLWTIGFVVVGGALALALTSSLDEQILRSSLVGRATTVVVTAIGGTAGTLLGRRYPAPDGVQPEPRVVLLTGPLAVTVVALVTGPAWDAALGGLIAAGATVALLAGDRDGR